MPTYLYKHKEEKPESCPRDEEFNMIQSIKDDAVKKCSYCGVPIERLIAPGGSFSLKGSGWTPKHYI